MIQEGSKVSLEYTLKLDDGEVADSNVGGDPLEYEQGTGQILPALEAALLGLAVNDTKQVTLSPENGYGVIDRDAFHVVEPDMVPEDGRKVGATLVAQDETGGHRPVRVAEVHDDRIIIDFNHPLAGQTLHFDVKVLGIA